MILIYRLLKQIFILALIIISFICSIRCLPSKEQRIKRYVKSYNEIINKAEKYLSPSEIEFIGNPFYIDDSFIIKIKKQTSLYTNRIEKLKRISEVLYNLSRHPPPKNHFNIPFTLYKKNKMDCYIWAILYTTVTRKLGYLTIYAYPKEYELRHIQPIIFYSNKYYTSEPKLTEINVDEFGLLSDTDIYCSHLLNIVNKLILENKDIEFAEKLINITKKLDYPSLEYNIAFGRLYAKKGQFRKAIKYLEKSIGRSRNKYGYLFLIGKYYAYLKDYEKAVTY